MNTKKKFFTLLIALIVLSTSVYANTNSTGINTDITKSNGTPQWLKDVRDTEIITLGALPFVTLSVSLGYSLYVLASNNFNSTYFVNPFAKSDAYTKEEQIGIIVTSSIICVGIGITNLTINLVKRKNAQKNNQIDLQENISITAIENELNVIPIPAKYNRDKKFLYGTMENAVF